ncbi:MAG TPA: DUF1579 family protein [Polyangia bacterium]
MKSLLAVWLVAGLPAIASAQTAKPAAAPAVAPAPAPVAAPVAPVAPAKSAAPVAPVAAPAMAPVAKAAPPVSAPVTKPAVTQAAAQVAKVTPAPVVASAVAHPGVAPVVAAAPVAPKPATELDQMKVLEGNWRCDGRAPAGPSGPERAYKSTWKFKRDLDNFWWAAEYQQTKAKANPMPMKARGYLTYDPASKGFVMLGVDNMGGTSSESTSGWSGDSVTLAGDASMGGRKIPFREVITKRGDREFTWRGEMRMGADWVTLGEDRCKK